MRSASFYSLMVEVAAARRASEINSRTCAWHDPGMAGRLLTVREAKYAGKCNAPGCTKVTKCHLPKATRCAPLQASSRRPVYNYMFLFSFLLSSLFFSSFIISRPPVLYVRKSHRTSCVRLSDGSTTDIYAQFSGIASEGASATSWTR